MACPLFVPLAEEGWHKGKITKQITETYLEEILKKDIDVMILGCTHYPLLKSAIQEVTGKSVLLVDSAEEIAREIRDNINKENNSEIKNSNNEFYLTDVSESFIRIAGTFLGEELNEVNLTDL